jgi:Putative zinc-finger
VNLGPLAWVQELEQTGEKGRRSLHSAWLPEKQMMPRLRNPLAPNPRTCESVRELMSDYIDGDLPAEARRRVDRHVRFCRRCSRVLANLRETLGRLGRLAQAPPPGAEDEAAVATRIRKAWRERS